MKRNTRYGSIRYYSNLLVLMVLSHRRRMQFFDRKIRLAETTSNPDLRLKLMLLCSDWSADLLESSNEVTEEFANRQEIEQLHKRMSERYRQERLNQGRI